MARSLTSDLIRTRWRIQKLLGMLRVEDWRLTESFDDVAYAFYEKFWQKASKNVGAELTPLSYGYWRIGRGDQWTLVNHHHVMLDYYMSLEMVGNKPLIHHLLKHNECPVPRFVEYDINSLGVARDFLKELKGRPGVVKPAGGTSGGKGITTKILQRDRLEKASIHAATFNWSLLLEEEVPGNSYRLLYLDGKLIDAIRRDPPTVTGDGKRTIQELIRAETKERIRDREKFRSLRPLIGDMECVYHLKEQGLSLKSVPAAGRQVAVKTVISDNGRPENHRVRTEVHPSIEQLGSRLATTLGLRLAGLDIIARSLDQPLESSGGVVNEINIPPGLHYHVLVAEDETTPPIGEMILETIFTSLKRSFRSATAL